MSEELNVGVSVTLSTPDDFLKCKETLSRIGVANVRDMKLFQSCHILHKKGKYYITHFKELFVLDGKPADITDDDIKRRNLIASLLSDWGLVKIENPTSVADKASISSVKIISHGEKSKWTLVAKYTVGKRR